MTPRRFAQGEYVRHCQMRLEGVVVRYFRPTNWPNGIVFWKGWDPCDPDRMDWTWEHAMEKIMMKVLMDDGRTEIECESAKDFVAKAHKLSHAPADSDQDWMDQVRERLVVAKGIEVRTKKADDFLMDLLAAGMVKRVDING